MTTDSTPPRSDDEARRLVKPPPPELGMRQGVVVEWDAADGSNVIDVGGELLTDLKMINLSDAPNVRVGDVVAVTRWQYTYFIIGRVVTAGSSDFGSAAIEFGHGTDHLQPTSVPTAITNRLVTDVPVPQWANQAAFQVLLNHSVFNSATATNVFLRAVGPAGGGATSVTGVETGMTRNISAFTQAVVPVVGGSDLTVYAQHWASPGAVPSAGTNLLTLDVNVTFTRVR